jgi:hypothetical protein
MSDEKLKVASISRAEVFMGRDREYPTTLEIRANADVLIARVNQLLWSLQIPSPVIVSSGYRPGRFNVAAGGAPHSAHLTAEAVDLADASGSLKAAIAGHPLGTETLLRTHGLWMEDPTHTPTWVHLDIKERNGPRVFRVK